MTTDYTITPINASDVRSPALRSIATQSADTLTDIFEINDPTGQTIAEAIIYQELPEDDHYTLAIDSDGSPSYYDIPTEEGQSPTDDDYDDALTDWIETHLIDFADNHSV